METVLKTSEKELIVFDYTHILSLLCNQKWTFVDFLQSVAPSFKRKAKKRSDSINCVTETLNKRALKTLSSSASDTQNIIRLLYLSRHEGIDTLMLLLPFALEQEQLQQIEIKGRCKIKKQSNNGESLLISLL